LAPKRLHLSELDFGERRDGNAVAQIAVFVDLHLRAGRERGGARRVVHGLAHVGQVYGVGITDIEIGQGAVGHDVRRSSALGDDGVLPPAHGVIWWAGAPQQGVLDAIDLETAGPESRRRTIRGTDDVTAYDHIHAVEHAGAEHIRFGDRRHHLLAGAAEDDHAAGDIGPLQPFGDGDRGGDADRSLGAP